MRLLENQQGNVKGQSNVLKPVPNIPKISKHQILLLLFSHVTI